MNQVIETVVTPLSLVAFLLAVYPSRTVSSAIVKGMCVGLLLILLFLTKGFQSCFVIVAPFISFILRKQKTFLFTGLVTTVVLITGIYMLMFVYEPSASWFSGYIDKRLKASLDGIGATTTYRAEILVRIVTELVVPLVIITGARWFLPREG